jgi:hypothetical protein
MDTIRIRIMLFPTLAGLRMAPVRPARALAFRYIIGSKITTVLRMSKIGEETRLTCIREKTPMAPNLCRHKQTESGRIIC